MDKWYSRTALLLGQEGISKLQKSRVALFGVGGVGSFVAEGLARCGVGSLLLVDNDTVSVTNINRQLIALHSTVGKYKVEVARDRILDINPDCNVSVSRTFFTPETVGEFDLGSFDYIVDAIDTVTGKLCLAVTAKELGVPIISSMGTGNKLDPTSFKIADISETKICPLARVMRRELKSRGIYHLKVLYSEEIPISPLPPEKSGVQQEALPQGRRAIPGSVSFVPSVAGLIIAGEVIRDLTNSG